MPGSDPKAIQDTCVFLKNRFGVKPGQSWGQLKDLDLRTFWDKNGCNELSGGLYVPPAGGAAGGPVTVPLPVQPPYRAHAYVSSWGGVGLRADLQKKTSMLVYAFWSLDPKGLVQGRDKTHEKIMASAGPPVLAGLGGWGQSANFSPVMKDDALRLQAVLSVGSAVEQAHWYGIDIDWEFPDNAGDMQHLVDFVTMYRMHWPTHVVTAAVSSDPARFGPYARQLDPLLDWLHVMTYDYVGPWTSTIDFNSSLNQGAASLKAYADAGYSKRKLMLGSAWYGRVATAISSDQAALQSVGTPVIEWEEQPYSYIESTYATWQHATALEKRETGSWQYSTPMRSVVVYEDPGVVAAKVAWVRQNGYAGVFCWEWGQDTADGDLARAMVQGL